MTQNREIKFRAWYHHKHNSDNGWMEYLELGINELYQDVFLLAKDFPRSGTGHYVPLKGFRHEKDFALMQYTGLKDKEGVEIYEGDILKWWVDSVNEFSKYPLIVVWEQSGFTLFSKLFSRFGLPDGSQCTVEQARGYMRDSEVIGNIYENPELLDTAEPSE